MVTQTQVILAKRPIGEPKASDFTIEHSELDLTAPCPAGKVTVRALYLSLDPAMRGWMNDVKSYIPPVKLGAPMRGHVVGEVVSSGSPNYSKGDLVSGMLNWRLYATVSAKALTKLSLPPSVPPTAALSVLGGTGMTAYFGLLDVGKPQTGETVLVSGAAGAVGSLVGQIAKLKGCKVIGIAGSDAKCNWLTNELKFDGAINYKTCPNIHKELRRLSPKGIDVYFDNVGGPLLDTVLRVIRRGSRIVICGAISQYNSTKPVQGPANYLSLLVNRARMEGFVVFDYVKEYPRAITDLVGWMRQSKLISRETIVRGDVTDAPKVLMQLFEGSNTGKLILQIGQPSGRAKL